MAADRESSLWAVRCQSRALASTPSGGKMRHYWQKSNTILIDHITQQNGQR